MRISHYNTFADGGSAVLMLRLHGALKEMGHDSRLRYRNGNLLQPEAQRLEYCQSGLDRQRERLQRRLEAWAMVPQAPSFYGRSRLHRPTPPPLEDQTADIIHLHWVSQWLDLPTFLQAIPKHIPIVWTIHDMSPLSGGCYLDFGCSEFELKCGRCPLLKPPFRGWFASQEWRRRSRALAGRRVFVVGNSTFTTNLAQRSSLLRHAHKITTIHPALDFFGFIRHDKVEARRLLGVPQGTFVLGFGAAALTDENKGFARFLEVAARVASRVGPVVALVFGDGVSAAGGAHVKVCFLGRLSSPPLQSLAYSAMDVFVMTSRMETFGQVATEAQACGTPVWAFDVGGLSEAIQNGVTGELVPFPKIDELAIGITAAKTQNRLAEMGNAAFLWATKNFSLERLGRNYSELYAAAVS